MCVSLNNFWTEQWIFIICGMNIMQLEAIPLSYFLIPYHQHGRSTNFRGGINTSAIQRSF